jgi:cell division protein ZapA (FtsZ GTPase activity inhibitor)
MNDPGKNSVTVRIAGEEHVIRSSADPEYTRRCAKFVDERILEVRQQAHLIEGHKAAILAALSITDQYLQALEELDSLTREVASRSRNLKSRIDAELPLGDG